MTEPEEIWKDVVGYEPHFMVSNKGNVFSKRTNKLLKLVISKTGYYIFSTKLEGRKGKAVCFKVHRLVAEAFLDKPNEHQELWASSTIYKKVFVNHKDLNKLNNSVENLEWSTGSENIIHAINHGSITYKLGCDNPSSKFTEEEVEYIRKVFIPKHREFGASALARKFKVHYTTIIRVAKKTRYKNV